MQFWIVIGLIAAMFYAVNHILHKKASEKVSPEYLVYSVMLLTGIISLPFIIIFKDYIVLPPQILWTYLLTGIILATGLILFTKSLQHAQIGKTVPLMAISPVVTMIFALIFLKEIPDTKGFIGIMMVVLGVYALKIDHFGKSHVLEPIINILKNRGSRYMLMASILYGINSVIEKYVIIQTNVFTRVVIYSYFVILIMTVYLIVMDGKQFKRKVANAFKKDRLWIALFTIGFAGEVIFTAVGLKLNLAAYAVSIKRVGIIGSVIFAHYMLNEKKHFLHHLLGAAMLVAGAMLIAM
ncbi:MAG: EamA family transporter [Nanoarchaeota archaeon]|nr:EamA family transporter [Nanoarchaeota archaeon]